MPHHPTLWYASILTEALLLLRSGNRPTPARFEIAGHVQSIAGCVAMSRQLLNIADVKHAQALQKKFIPS
jgi:hypothetical protein